MMVLNIKYTHNLFYKKAIVILKDITNKFHRKLKKKIGIKFPMHYWSCLINSYQARNILQKKWIKFKTNPNNYIQLVIHSDGFYYSDERLFSFHNFN